MPSGARSVVVLDGVRTPYVKAWAALQEVPVYELGRIAVRELLDRSGIRPDEVDEVIVGNVAQPAEAANVARVIALEAGLPDCVPAHTVCRNCASGMDAIAQAYEHVRAGRADLVVAGGVESMSQIPLLWDPGYAALLNDLRRAKTPWKKLAAAARIRPRHFRPIVALMQGLTDRTCSLNMGETAEVLAREFDISREAQDAFALQSHQRATAARDRLAEEIVPVLVPPDYTPVTADVGPRENQTLEALAALRPYFDRRYGTITAGNSSPITDGAVAVLVTTPERARALGIEPLGEVVSYAWAALDPRRMGLGPAYATPKALDAARMTLDDVDLIEINEAFAAQVIANEIAWDSDTFAREALGRTRRIGALDRAKTNVNGGAIALGHPVGSSGARIVLTLLKEMRRRDAEVGLATLCIGGGQGGAMVVRAAA
ncbi:MAG: thiolase family protein [Gemmatimonadota bacterium]